MRKSCHFLDGAVQDIPDIDSESINIKTHVEVVVNAAFFADGDRQKEAIEEVGGMLSSHCFFIRELTSRSISKITGFDKDHHRISTS